MYDDDFARTAEDLDEASGCIFAAFQSAIRLKCFVERTTTAAAVDPKLAEAYLDEVYLDDLPDDEIDRIVDDARQNGCLSVLMDFLDSWVGPAQQGWARAKPHLLLVAHGDCHHYTAMRYATGVLSACHRLRPIPTRRKLKRSLDAARDELNKMPYYDFDAMVTRMEGELVRAQAALQSQVQISKGNRNEAEQVGATHWPPDTGWHFRHGQVAFSGILFDLGGVPHDILKALVGHRCAMTLDSFHGHVTKWDEGVLPTSGGFRSQLTPIRNVLRTNLNIPSAFEPIPVCKIGDSAAWKLADELRTPTALEAFRKLSAVSNAG